MYICMYAYVHTVCTYLHTYVCTHCTVCTFVLYVLMYVCACLWAHHCLYNSPHCGGSCCLACVSSTLWSKRGGALVPWVGTYHTNSTSRIFGSVYVSCRLVCQTKLSGGCECVSGLDGGDVHLWGSIASAQCVHCKFWQSKKIMNWKPQSTWQKFSQMNIVRFP